MLLTTYSNYFPYESKWNIRILFELWINIPVISTFTSVFKLCLQISPLKKYDSDKFEPKLKLNLTIFLKEAISVSVTVNSIEQINYMVEIVVKWN